MANEENSEENSEENNKEKDEVRDSAGSGYEDTELPPPTFMIGPGPSLQKAIAYLLLIALLLYIIKTLLIIFGGLSC